MDNDQRRLPDQVPSTHPLIGRVLGERYEMQDILGGGGVGIVFQAWDRQAGRPAAVKVLAPHLARDPRALVRFRREAAYAQALSPHPNIVSVYDLGEEGIFHYLAMELVEGETLKKLIEREGRLAVPQALSIASTVARVLDFAHQRGFVHRDVKPQNILLTPRGDVKVSDFGIAHHESATAMTATGVMIGTADYFSPEQARGREVSPASDIYSLGVVLYEMLSGRLPFYADTPIGVALQHIQDPPPPIRQFNRAIPPALAMIVDRTLRKGPADRFAGAAELAMALEAVQL